MSLRDGVPNVNGLDPHPANPARRMPKVRGVCPSCEKEDTLFLATGGYVTCVNLDCEDPSAASAVLQAMDGESDE